MKKSVAISHAILSAAGFSLSLYSFAHHLKVRLVGFTSAACNINELVSCDKVALSPYSEIIGVPLGALGLLSFGIEIIALLVLIRRPNIIFFQSLHAIHIITGAVASFGLASISIGILHSICLICVGIYAICLVQLILWVKFHYSRKSLLPKILLAPIGATLILIAITSHIYRIQKPRLAREIASRASKDLLERKGPFAHLSASIDDTLIDRTFLSQFPHQGPLNAKAVLVVFVDPQCPSCAEASPKLEEVFSRSKDLLLVNILYPLSNQCNPIMLSDMHPESCQYSRAALCAHKHEKYLPFIKSVYDNQWSLFEKPASHLLATASVDKDKAEECQKDPNLEKLFKSGLAAGNYLQLRKTPGVFLNGREYTGPLHPAFMDTFITSFLNSVVN